MIKNENVTTALLGAPTPAQLRETLGAGAGAQAGWAGRKPGWGGGKPACVGGLACRVGGRPGGSGGAPATPDPPSGPAAAAAE